ncbi:hypothetical protein ACFQV2_20110 [Actinokineospora soli]|uniref:Uncharacterized protein n=1 Tax=Actinokineospora soli TaxID=1048753 RepID=A0ABW2TQE2_9PSEU
MDHRTIAPHAAWEADRLTAAAYGRQRLGACAHADPAEFAVVWANMRRGHRSGELRERPRLDVAFDEWLAEALSEPAAPEAAR